MKPPRRDLPALLVLALAWSACDGSGPSSPSTATVLAECDLLEPVWGNAECPRLTGSGCLAVNWTGSVASSPANRACFGHFEDIASCPSCNILSLDNYTSCKNRQYIDCLLDGHLAGRSGDLCFVTRLDHIQLAAPVRVTARELCYYVRSTGRLPPECPSQCQGSFERGLETRGSCGNTGPGDRPNRHAADARKAGVVKTRRILLARQREDAARRRPRS